MRGKTHKAISRHTIATVLKRKHPDIYSEIVNSYQPLQHDVSLIPKLYEATTDKILFYGAILFLFSRYPVTSLRGYSLHDGILSHLSAATGLKKSNLCFYLSQARAYYQQPGFEEQVKKFLSSNV